MNIKNCVQISSIELLKTTSTTLSDIGKQQSDTDGLVRSDTAFYCALYLSALFSSHHLQRHTCCKKLIHVLSMYSKSLLGRASASDRI